MNKEETELYLKDIEQELKEFNSFIWNHPEISGQETECAEYQITLLEKYGFEVERYKQLPTAFVAAYGKGKIKVGLASEYDALPGLAQKCVPYQESTGQKAGHGCGHNLICTGCITAALLLKRFIDYQEMDGRVYYYGCAAEETLTGKHIMIEEGGFKELDFCLTWHPFDVNKVYDCSTLAAVTADFRFTGTMAHAAVAPHLGRSALDAVEIMNVGANYLREHIIDAARIHYIITDGGAQMNVVPKYAASRYMIRAPKVEQVLDILKRVVKLAEGAAIMTETSVEYEVVSGNYEYVPNRTLGNILRKYFEKYELPKLEEKDRVIYDKIAAQISDNARRENCRKFGIKDYEGMDKEVLMTFFDPTDWSNSILPGSSDLGDVSCIVPVGKIAGGAWALGTANHTWQATACSGTLYAAELSILIGRILAETACEVASKEDILKSVREEFELQKRQRIYKPLKSIRIEE